jgi:hypothetical protein
MKDERRVESTVHPHTGGHVARAHEALRSSHGGLFEWGPVPRPLRVAAVRRLGWAALICVGISLALAGIYAGWIRDEWVTRVGRYYSSRVLIALPPILGAFTLSISVGLFVLTRRRNVDPQRVLNLGLVWQFFVCASLSFLQHVHGWEGLWIYSGWSNTASFLLVFAALVPATPGRALLSSAASAAWDPIALAVTVAAGAPMPRAPVVALLLAPTVLAVICSWIIARIVHGLGRELERAEQIGSYRLVERLGEGGMGEVWRAEHASLARPAAIKLIRPDALAAGDEDRTTAVRRFEQEAQATAQLRSPHTITLYDFGQTADGACYYVMELLDGIDLQALVDRFGPLPPERAVHVLRQVCRSLAEAHERGLVHRDVKPANIYLCRQGIEVDFVKVLDFGLVKHTARSSGEPHLTQEGQISGTPSYMAPEVARGEALDRRADLYAVGCVAYWLLAGRTVFPGDTAMKQILAHVGDTPSRPSLHGAVPQALDELVLRCLAKSPSERPATAQAIAAELDAVPVERPWTDERARAWWDEHLPLAGPKPPPGPDSYAPTERIESPSRT